MDNPAVPALELGEQMLALLKQPVSDEMLQQMEALLDRRGAALEKADPAVLPQLAEQQVLLEALMQQTMETIGLAVRQSQAQAANLQGVQRLLKPAGPSRYLSEKR